MKIITIPVSDSPECAIALHHGFTLGKKTGASVIGYHIRPHTYSDAHLAKSDLNSESPNLSWEKLLNENTNNNTHIKAQLLFEKLLEQYDFELINKPKYGSYAMWMEKVGSPEKLFSIIGPVSDLIVVSRPLKKSRSMARRIMLSAVMNSSTPILVLPQKKVAPLGKRICIAWNQSKEAMLAVKAAIPLLQDADEVNIISSGAENMLGPKVSHLKKYLLYWNVKANHIKVKGKNDVEVLLTGYKQSNSDLLVMGGYSRSRMRQIVFGGVTEYMPVSYTHLRAHET